MSGDGQRKKPPLLKAKSSPNLRKNRGANRNNNNNSPHINTRAFAPSNPTKRRPQLQRAKTFTGIQDHPKQKQQGGNRHRDRGNSLEGKSQRESGEGLSSSTFQPPPQVRAKSLRLTKKELLANKRNQQLKTQRLGRILVSNPAADRNKQKNSCRDCDINRQKTGSFDKRAGQGKSNSNSNSYSNNRDSRQSNISVALRDGAGKLLDFRKERQVEVVRLPPPTHSCDLPYKIVHRITLYFAMPDPLLAVVVLFLLLAFCFTHCEVSYPSISLTTSTDIISYP